MLVWGSIAFCLLAVAVTATRIRLPALFGDARRAPGVAGVLAFIAFVSVRLTAVGPTGGDEPHYLVIAQSLLKDGDIKVANNYERKDYLEYGADRCSRIIRGRPSMATCTRDTPLDCRYWWRPRMRSAVIGERSSGSRC